MKPDTTGQGMSADTECTRWVYDHLRITLERDDRAYEMYISKSRQMMAVVVGSAAAPSFALTKSEWAVGSVHIVLFSVLAAFSGLSLAAAFVAGCLCIQIKRAAVVGVNRVLETLDQGPIQSGDSTEVYRGLTANIATAIVDNRKLRNSQQSRAGYLNLFTLIAVALTILSVFYAVLGDTISSNIAAKAESEKPTNVRVIQAE